MPKPKKGETKNDFISRCIPIILEDGTTQNQKQAVAICYSIWRREGEDDPEDDPKSNNNDINSKNILNSMIFNVLF